MYWPVIWISICVMYSFGGATVVALLTSSSFGSTSSVAITFMKFDCLVLQVKSHICRTKLAMQDGHRARKLAARATFLFNTSTCSESQHVFTLLLLSSTSRWEHQTLRSSFVLLSTGLAVPLYGQYCDRPSASLLQIPYHTH
uniref:Putative secreted protein n=1 Tax=Anopheles darlingi TaxID=43151 RepID=A0A2M4D6J5_ANODA